MVFIDVSGYEFNKLNHLIGLTRANNNEVNDKVSGLWFGALMFLKLKTILGVEQRID